MTISKWTGRTALGTTWLFVVLFMVPLVGFIHRLIINILIDPISLEFSLTDTQASYLQGPPFAIVYGLMVIPMGLLADRGNRVLLLSSGAALWSLGTVICGVAPTFELLFAARMLVGLGEAALLPAAVSLIGDAFEENRRGLAMGIFFTGVNAGFSSAYAVGGITLELAEAGLFQLIPFLTDLSPWRQVFVVLSVPGFLLPLLLLTIGEPDRHDAGEGLRLVQPLRRLIASRSVTIILLLVMLQAALLAVADNGIYAWLPRLLSRMYLLEPTEIGLVLGAVVATAGAVSGPMAGRLSDYLIKSKGVTGPLIVIIAAIGGALLAAPLFAMGSAWLVYAATGLWVTAVVAATATTFTFVSVALPGNMRGVTASLITSIIALVGLGGGPTIIAVVLESFAVVRGRVDLAIVVAAFPLCAIALLVTLSALRVAKQPRAFALHGEA